MAQLSYPGVYIEEISSGVRPITGVATSIAAFVGWAPQGPTDEAILVQSWPEFQNRYGGLNAQSRLGHVVNQFFGNGGQQAYIVRLAWQANLAAAPGTQPAACATASSSGIGNATTVVTATFHGVSAQTTVAASAPTLASIQVSAPSPTMPQTLTQQLTAVGSYSDGSTQDLTSDANIKWNSDNAVVGLSLTGLATAGNADGTANITAKIGAVTSAPIVLTVNDPALKSINVTPAAVTAVAGTQRQFTATGTYADNSSFDLTGAVKWTSSDPNVTIPLAGGLASIVTADGTAKITAALGAANPAEANVTVLPAVPTSLAITPSAPTVPQGASVQLSVIGTYAGGVTFDLTQVAGWASVNVPIATVGKTGLATAVSAGTAQITATVGAVVAKVQLTVSAALPTSISVSPANPTVGVNKTLQLSVTGNYPGGTTQDLTGSVQWQSGAPGIANVSASGLVTGGAQTNPGALTLYANSPGIWGNGLQVAVGASRAAADRFSVTIQDAKGNTLEYFPNLSTNPLDPLGHYAVNVIDNDSNYVTFVNPATPNAKPAAPNGTPSTTAAAVPLVGGLDGTPLVPATDGNFETALGIGQGTNATFGVELLDRADIFNLLCVPGETDVATITALQTYCKQKRAFYIVDCPQNVTISSIMSSGPVGTTQGAPAALAGGQPTYAAYYFPWVLAPDPLMGGRPTHYPPCGFVAGLYAATDASRGVWKAPAGLDASLSNTQGLQFNLTDLENGTLNQQAVNCLRQLRLYGNVVWGARTLDGNDEVGSEWKYVPIRRLALFIESSLFDGTQWVVFEPNDEPLWSQIRMNVGVFMQGLFRQGAFQGSTPQQAYFVKCDAESNPQASIDLGVVNILVGFAPLYPAEFVVIRIQQMAGQLQS
ncbi:Ig-like domain-containing protein [Paraburkholderia fungorum]|uniref:Ig-like domain-containing protein n=1 Tax=Paraburkholderia fungorum TaxID=134537 RepID=UPI0038B79F72